MFLPVFTCFYLPQGAVYPGMPGLGPAALRAGPAVARRLRRALPRPRQRLHQLPGLLPPRAAVPPSARRHLWGSSHSCTSPNSAPHLHLATPVQHLHLSTPLQLLSPAPRWHLGTPLPPHLHLSPPDGRQPGAALTPGRGGDCGGAASGGKTAVMEVSNNLNNL